MRRLYLVAAAVLALVAGLTAPASGQEADRTPTLTVMPATDLVDGQVVTVSGSGWQAGAEVSVLTCAEAGYPCLGLERVVADGAGAFGLTYTVRAFGHSSDWVECRVLACDLVAKTPRGEPVRAPLTFDPDAPLLDQGVANVTPSDSLIDGERVQVTGAGWAGDTVEVQLCGRFSRVCDRRPRRASVAPDGSFAMELPVRTRMVHWDDTVEDCRQVACEIRVGDLHRWAIVPVAFDPLAPVLEPRLSIAPAGTLVNGQVVTLTGSGFLPGEPLLVRQRCYQAPDCGERVVPDAAGGFTSTYQVRDVVDIYHASVDCRGVGRCAIRVVEPNTWIEVANAPLTFAPEGDEVVTVRPSSGLEDGDAVRVDATGLNRGHGVEVNQCVALSGNPFPFPYTDWRCAGPAQRLGVDDQGEIHTTLRVRRGWPSTAEEHPQPFDCRVDRCRLVVGGPGVRVYIGSTFSGYRTYWNRTPLTFADDLAPPAPPPTPATPTFAG